MTASVAALVTILVGAAVYDLAILVVALRFRRWVRPRPDRGEVVGVSILVPLEGAEPGLFENLAAYCRLRYAGSVQLVVGSLDADDPALATARLVAAGHHAADVVIVAGGGVLGANRKASLLAALAAHARHPIIAALDSDVRVAPDYLQRVVPALLGRGVGLVSCVYRAPRPETLAQAYEALCIDTDFCASVMLARVLGRRDIALGASIVLRASTLRRIGGFAAAADHLPDDHRIGKLVNALGERVTLAPCVVESNPNPGTFAGALRHQLRWARTVRACAPWGYVANVLTHGTTFVTAALLVAARLPSVALDLAAAVVMLLRVGAAIAATRALGAAVDWTLTLLPFRDLTATAIWLVSMFGDRVEWRGRHYRIGPQGVLYDVIPTRARRKASDVADAAWGGAAADRLRGS